MFNNSSGTMSCRQVVQGSLILPGPAVTAATPTTPDSLATASAANTAVT